MTCDDRDDLDDLRERIEALEARHRAELEEVHEEIARLGVRLDEIENALDAVMGQRLE